MRSIFKSTLNVCAALILGGLVHPAFAQVNPSATPTPTPPQERIVAIAVNGAYIPSGFDSDADAYVVVSGVYPNSCYKWRNADIKNVDTFNHEIRSYATVTPGMCLMMMIPFNKEVRLGKLASGAHTLKFMNGDGTYMQKTLNVE